MYTQPSALQIRWGNILAQVIIALSNHLLPVTDGVIALLEPDALTNLHAIVTIQKMQKDALEIQILEHKLKVFVFFVLSGNKKILIISRLSLLEHGLWWDKLFC